MAEEIVLSLDGARWNVAGVSRYAAELLSGMRAAGRTVRMPAGTYASPYLRGQPGVIGVPFPQMRGIGVLGRQFERAWLAARRRGRPIVHHKVFSGPLRTPDGLVSVVTVHDMVNERFPELFGDDDATVGWKRDSCERADIVLVVSDTTRRDLLERIPVDPDRVRTVHLATSMGIATPAELEDRPRGGDRVLLHVGARGSYKNFSMLVDALALLSDRSVRLLNVGGGPFSPEEAARARRLGVSDRVSWQAAADPALRQRYLDAAVLVSPSLYEGFGLPVLEAMGLGCPVVCADAGSLPEVAGGAALLFAPTDAAALAVALERVLDDDATRARLRVAGLERARDFSWRSTVDATLAAYDLATEHACR